MCTWAPLAFSYLTTQSLDLSVTSGSMWPDASTRWKLTSRRVISG
ncbi:hypothetical protein BX257_6680 [Streptomyces sp. 3212.3]|nr:hypothetical protein BX257_6680 [Streptomyces sp. 3212.3]